MSAPVPAVPAKGILSARYEGGWFGANYTMNLYRGCSHGCVYCDSRSECYRVTDFDTVRQKEDALTLLGNELRAARRAGTVISGSMSDCYNPCEKDLRLMRGALELFLRHGFGVAVETKSVLCLRDIDLLKLIGRANTTAVSLTITTADDHLSALLEPGAPPSRARFEALHTLADAGIDCGILLMPVLPFITDSADNIAQIVARAQEAGARWIFPCGGFGVTLRQNQRVHYLKHIERLFPGMRKRYIDTYSDAYNCAPPGARELYAAFRADCDARGLLYDMRDIARFVARRRPQQTRLI